MSAVRAVAAALVVVTVLSACGSSHPTTVSADLGPMPTDVPETSNGVFGFQRAGPSPHQGSKVDFLVFDTLWDSGSAFDRWAEVKALSQFGTWSSLKEGQTTERAAPTPSYTNIPYPYNPTPDVSHAIYKSSYVAFVHHVVQSKPNGPLTRLPPAQEALLTRYGRLPEQLYTAAQTPWPVILVGGYVMHGQVITSPIVQGGTSPAPPISQAKLFAWFRSKISQRTVDRQQAYWTQPLNDFASTIAAVICHADGQRPRSACIRPVIRTIEHRLP